MLQVLPIQSKEAQAALCARCALPYDPDCLAYEATVDGTSAGVCQFRINDKGGFIYGLASVDDASLSAQARAEAIFVMGRAALNFMDLCGVRDAYFADAHFADEAMIRAIGFRRREDGAWHMDVAGFFTSSPCQYDNR